MAARERAGRGGRGAGTRLGRLGRGRAARGDAARRDRAGRRRGGGPPHGRPASSTPTIVNPVFGWRGLAAARAAGARVVLHVHNYRLVCAVGTCFTHGEDCTRCHGRNTAPGVALRCRGSRAEAAVYANGLALWQRRLVAQADRFVVPSAFARDRLAATGRLPRGPRRVVPHVVPSFAAGSAAADGRSRSWPAAWRRRRASRSRSTRRARGVPLVVAGDGPAAEELRERRPRPGTTGSAVRSRRGVYGAAGARRTARDGRRSPSCRRARRRRSGSRPRRRWRTRCRSWPRGRRAAPSSSADDGALVRLDDGEALAAAIPARFGDAEAGARGPRRLRERCARSRRGPPARVYDAPDGAPVEDHADEAAVGCAASRCPATRAGRLDRLGAGYEVRVLEPSPPAVAVEPYADDPAARGTVPDGRALVAPTTAGDVTWDELAREDSELAEWCGGALARRLAPPFRAARRVRGQPRSRCTGSPRRCSLRRASERTARSAFATPRRVRDAVLRRRTRRSASRAT